MTSQQLHRAVARATGEDISVIRRLGFNLSTFHHTLDDIDHERDNALATCGSACESDLDADGFDRGS